MSKPLNEFADIQYGKSPKDVFDEDGTVPIVGTGGIYGQAKEFLFQGPAVVVPRKGSLGNPQYMGTPFWPVDTTYAVLPKPEVDARWLYYSLARFDLTKLNEATGVPSISRDWLYKVPLADMDYTSQQKIAKILATVDEAIEQTEALIAKTQQIKAGLMHDLFTRGVTKDGQLRPPREEAPHLYKESPLGWIPKEWKAEKLGRILERHGGYLQTGPFGSQLHAHEYKMEGVPVVMPQDINDGKIFETNIARIDEVRANDLFRHRLRIGDIVIARRGELSRAGAISKREEGWLCGTGCFLLRLGDSELQTDFASHVYRQDFIQRQIAGRAVGTTMPSLNNSVMSALWFPFCEPVEQYRIVDRLETVENKQKALDNELQITRQMRNGLMYDLLTGRVRVPIESTTSPSAHV